jgi:hypothetical protein
MNILSNQLATRPIRCCSKILKSPVLHNLDQIGDHPQGVTGFGAVAAGPTLISVTDPFFANSVS